jgi:hypothetical protein
LAWDGLSVWAREGERRAKREQERIKEESESLGGEAEKKKLKAPREEGGRTLKDKAEGGGRRKTRKFHIF